MNKLIIVTIVALAISVANADTNCSTTNKSDQVTGYEIISTDVPSHLKGATITVTKANGETSTVPAEQFKVVARKQQRLISKVLEKETVTCNEGLANKNRVSLLAGYGASGDLDRKTSVNHVDVKTNTGFNAGVQYQRVIHKQISVGGQVQSNKAGAVMIGVDF